MIKAFFKSFTIQEPTVPQAWYDTKVQECNQLASELNGVRNANSVLSASNQELRKQLEELEKKKVK